MGLGGCALPMAEVGAMDRNAPHVILDPDGQFAQFKRYERRMARDFVSRFSRKAYYACKDAHLDLSSPEQQSIVEQWGNPDYIRKPFQSLEGEWIEEWVYFDNKRVFQFKNHQLVYEGPLTDLEQLLLRLGYPNRAEITKGESGLVKHLLIYQHLFQQGRNDSYELADGWIVYSIEAN